MSAASDTDLFAHIDQEDWLRDRLLRLGANLEGVFPTLKVRLRRVIESQGFETIIAGRNASGRPETFVEAWERIYRDTFHVKPNKRGKR